MSIYATMLCLMDFEEWKRRTEKSPTRVYGSPDDQDAELGGPRPYRGSHVMPREDDARDGLLEVSYIPDHIKEVRGVQSVDYLRLSVGAKMDAVGCVDDETVVLDRPQVEALREALSWWLDAPERP